MEWKRPKITRWHAGPFMITEEITGERPYRLDGPDDSPQHFATLTEAKAQAATLNELAVYKAEVCRLRAELDTRAGKWPADVDAARQGEEPSDTIPAKEHPWAGQDDGRGIPAHAPGGIRETLRGAFG